MYKTIKTFLFTVLLGMIFISPVFAISVPPEAILPLGELSTENSSPFNFTLFLKQGSNGNEVKELQKFLNNHNYIVSSSGLGSVGNETIYFRSKTKTALIKFQIANELVGDGVVGSLTRAVLNK